MKFDGVPISVLIDIGAHISVMSANLRHCLHKVLTPAAFRTLQVADGETAVVHRMCTARICIAGHSTPVQFAVIHQCTHDLILGLDFLSSHSALIV